MIKLEYAKKSEQKWMGEMIKKNNDNYGKSVIDTAIYAMKLMMNKKLSVKKCWHMAFKKFPNTHSIMSAATTATIVARVSPRGKEFEKWCIKTDAVMVNWS